MEDVKKKILMVDDDEFQLSFAEAVLKDDYDVITDKSGVAALDRLYHGLVPDLILLDILMPEMDGFETYNRIRTISFLQNIPIVFLSSIEETNKVQEALDIGAADYIKKPYNKDNLLSRIRNVVKISNRKEIKII